VLWFATCEATVGPSLIPTVVANCGRCQPPAPPSNPSRCWQPLDSQLRDYPSRIADLLRTLSVVEDRRPDDVLREMVLPSSDKQHLRLDPPTPSAQRLLRTSWLAVTGLRTCWFLLRVRRSVQEVQAVQPAQKPQRVKEFNRSGAVGPNPAGELYHLQPHATARSLTESAHVRESPPEPFERQVSRQLYAGVVCAFQAATLSIQQDSLDDFDRYTGCGAVS